MTTLLHLPMDSEGMPLGMNVVFEHSPRRLVGTTNGSPSLTSAQKKYGDRSLLLAYTTANNVLFPAMPEFSLFTGPFTLAFNIYLNAYNSSWSWLIAAGSSGFANATNGIHWIVQVNANGVHLTWYNGSSFSTLGAAVSLNTWTHIEFGFDGTTLYVFKGGVLVTSTIPSVGFPSVAPPLCIGGVNNLTSAPAANNCYLDDLLIDKGTCLHTTGFTPSAIPYTPITPTLDLIGRDYDTSAYPVPAPCLKREASIPLFKDVECGGKGKIVGTTKVKGAPDSPVARRVVLHRQRDGVRVAETWSNTNGDYEFKFIDPVPTYFTVSFDHTGMYRGVIADGLTAVSM